METTLTSHSVKKIPISKKEVLAKSTLSPTKTAFSKLGIKGGKENRDVDDHIMLRKNCTTT